MAAVATFGQVIKHRRRALDMTQRDLANQVGYSVITIRKVETDERRPSVSSPSASPTACASTRSSAAPSSGSAATSRCPPHGPTCRRR